MASEIYSVITPVTDLLDNPDNGLKIGARDSQLLFGESVEILQEPERREGFSYIKSKTDGYQGFVQTPHLSLSKTDPTHFIDRTWAHIYPEPSFKTRPVMGLGFMSRLTAGKNENGFAEISGHGWVFEDHINPLSSLTTETDCVETALTFLSCPYLYGGRSAQGLDCSALVQLSLLRSGIPCPRDSDQQIDLGESVEKNDIKRGDLVFFKGHVGIMTDPENILNATSRTMDVRIEKLNDLENLYSGITGLRRLI